jgi:hypothetical protein
MKKQISEEINSMKFLLNYKRGIVISEQATTTPGGIPQKAVDKIMAISAENKKGFMGSYLAPAQQQEIDSEFGAGTYSKFFRNGGEDVLKAEPKQEEQSKNIPQIPLPNGVSQQAVDKIMAISAKNKKGFRGSYLFKPQAQEIDSEFGTGTYSNFFKNGGEDVLKGEKTFQKQTQINTTSDWSKYPCVSKHPQAKKGKTAKGSEYYQINNYYYYDNGRKYEITTKKTTNYTCNDPEFKTNQIKKSTPIPTELKNIEGVKLFQDWLDINAQGWATGFTNGKLNKGTGYGNFGPRTQKAWTLYGKEYLQSLNTPVENEKESPFMKSQLEKIKSERPNPASFTAPIQKVGTPLQSAQNPVPTVNRGVNQLKPQ